MAAIFKPIAIATLVAGTLDLAFAMILTALPGRSIAAMLRHVASGPIPPAAYWGLAGAALGIGVHYGLMAIMATAFMRFVARHVDSATRVLLLGAGFGVLTWVAMNFIIVPLRFDTPLPPPMRAMLSQLFAHVVLVGLPMALIARRERFE